MSKIHLPRNEQIKLLQSIAEYANCTEKFLDKVHFDCDLAETAEGYSSYLNSALHDFPKIADDIPYLEEIRREREIALYGTDDEQVRQSYAAAVRL